MSQRTYVLDRLLTLMGAAGLMLATSCAMDMDSDPADTSANATALAVAAGRPDVASKVLSGHSFLLGTRGKMGLDANNDFVARTALVDDLGATHVRYDQTYRGVKVWGGETIVHQAATGRGTELTSEIKSGINNLSTVPALSTADVLSLAHNDLRPIGPYASAPTAELIVYPHVFEQVRVDAKPLNGELNALDMERVVTGYSLAYHVHTALENGTAETRHTDYIIDARTGQIYKKWDSLETTAATGTGNSQYSGVKTINVNTISGGWEMRDVVTSMNYATYNLNHATSGQGTIYTDTDNTWGDGANYVEGSSTTAANGQTAAVDAHFGVGQTAAYYLNVHGRNGIDGAGKATYSRVHYSNSYDNAFWDDTCFCMTYGDGSSFTTLTAIDVAGHEMAHGVTARTANLTYSGESGGLNESMSDVNGTMVEFYSRGGSGSTIGNTGGTWTIGEQLSSTPLRYMYKPSKDGSSPDAWSSSIGNLDVHYSSGPHNRMFYFLSQGASSTSGSDFYSSYLPCGMTGIGNDEAARLAYKALSTYMTSSTNYAAARTAYLNAATALYGSASPEYTAVQKAFAAINVGTFTCSSGPDFSLSASPASRSVLQGGSTTYTVTETPSGGFTGSVTLAASGLPTGATASFSANPTTGSSTLTVATATTTPTGSYTITITGTSGTLSHTTTVTLVVTSTSGCGTNLLLNPGFESGAVNWTATAGVLGNTGTAHTGTQFAWLDGYGTTHTDTLSQSVTSACSVQQLCLWLRITTSETTTTTAYDTLKVQYKGVTLGTFSNLNASAYSSYKQACFTVSGTPSSSAVNFVGAEDVSLQTSFFIDDVSLQ